MREIIIHIPLPYYSSDQLVRTMFSHSRFHLQYGTFVPQPKLYQHIARHCLKEEPSKQNFSFLRRSLLCGVPRGAKKIFLSFAGIPNSPLEIVSEEGIIPDLSVFVRRVDRIFHDFNLKIIFGIVNQGRLIGSLIQNSATLETALETALLAPSIYWSDAIGACKDDFKRINFVVWRHEESITLWPKIIRLAAGLPESVIPPGSFDMLVQKLSDEGIKNLKIMLSRTSHLSQDQANKIIITFMSSKKFTRRLNTEVCINGWTRDVVSHFDGIYQDDVNQIFLDKEIFFLKERMKSCAGKEPYNA